MIGREECFSTDFSSWETPNDCSENDWLKPTSGYFWTITSDASTEPRYYAFKVIPNGVLSGEEVIAPANVLPVGYLKPDVQIVSGTGSIDSAFELNEITTAEENNILLKDALKSSLKVVKGTGLYEVSHENVTGTTDNDGFSQIEYRFAGIDPNNYIKFNNELWRMIGLVNVRTPNGVEQRIKISKAEVLSDNKEFDSNNINDWTNSSLMKYLNGEYYNNSLTDENSKNMIDESVIWSIGGTDDDDDDLVTKWYERERSTIRGTDHLYPHEWSSTNATEEVAFHGIGLIYFSDYAYAISGGIYGRNTCLAMSPFEWYKSCTQDWLGLEGEKIWTLSSYGVGNVVIYHTEVSYWGEKMTDMLNVVPSLYLKPNIEITNLNEANGSHNLPYELKLIS